MTDGKVYYYWDTSDPDNEGWFAEVVDMDNNITMDSLKRWFPVDLEGYEKDDAVEVLAELEDAFPGHELILKP